MAVGTAMPTAHAALEGLAWYAWPFSAFLVAQGVGMVVGGDLGDRRGAWVALPWGAAAFAAGLLTAGLAGERAVFVSARAAQGLGGGLLPAGLAGQVAVFVGGRAVQGLGGGVISGVLYVVAGQGFEPALRPRLFGAISAGWVLPGLVGPLVAGLLTTHAGWRWVFLGMLPLIAVSLALVLPAVRALPATGNAAPAGTGRRWWALLAGSGI